MGEANLQPNAIDGIAEWDSAVSRNVIVSSVDEYHRDDGGISRMIAQGCSLQSLLTQRLDPVEVGDTTLQPCHGPYEEFGITSVASAAIVVWKEEGTRNKCDRASSEYQSCLSRWINGSLNELFYQRREWSNTDTVIIPALGTGTGGLEPGYFYQALDDVLQTHLASSILASHLPKNIVLLAWRDWSPTEWNQHRYSTANLVSSLYNGWGLRAKALSDTTTPANVLGVLGALLIGLARGGNARYLTKGGLAALGSVALLSTLVRSKSGFGVLSNVGIGFLAGVTLLFLQDDQSERTPDDDARPSRMDSHSQIHTAGCP